MTPLFLTNNPNICHFFLNFLTCLQFLTKIFWRKIWVDKRFLNGFSSQITNRDKIWILTYFLRDLLSQCYGLPVSLCGRGFLQGIIVIRGGKVLGVVEIGISERSNRRLNGFAGNHACSNTWAVLLQELGWRLLEQLLVRCRLSILRIADNFLWLSAMLWATNAASVVGSRGAARRQR